MALVMGPMSCDTHSMAESTFPVTERTRVRRLPQRATHERAVVHAILDAGLVCHVGLVEAGRPVVIPTAYARVDDTLVLHGSTRSRTLMAAADGVDLCCTVTLLDGLVLARSAFHHSINYRSVVAFGRARVIEDEPGRIAALRAFTERLYPGRWDEVREPSAQELKATMVLALPLTEAVAKVRTGPPVDDEEDYALPVWAGVVPLSLAKGEAEADERLFAGTTPPVRVWPGR
jgi:nitroimidazol reductase NimA-like FMN-containing flavoprotein (pyridoxamine 5'-phosphate oxidase superfamily)